MTPDECSNQLQKLWNDGLKEHGAIDMIAGENFVGYIVPESNDEFSVDVYSWGVNHGKIFCDKDVEKLKDLCFKIYDSM